MIEYYNKLEEVDKDIEAIRDWQQKQIIKLYEKTEKKLNKAFAKLGKHIPEEVKNARQ
jgi:hypothetical protein